MLGDDGSGVISSVIEAIDWAIEHQAQYRIGVINLSLGAPVLQPYRDDPMCEAVERAVRAGIVVVAAAGNFGRGRNGRRGVRRHHHAGQRSRTCSRWGRSTRRGRRSGPTTWRRRTARAGRRCYDLVSKPDVLAPGSRIVSAEAAGSVAAREHPERHVTGAGANGYIQFSGTSMAAGVVSGAVALLLQGDPQLTPAEVKAVIQLTSSFVPSPGRAGRRRRQPERAGGGAFVASGYAELPATTIAAERIAASGLVGLPIPAFRLVRRGARSLTAGGGAASIVWGDDIGARVVCST